ncbi:MAG: DJ-1/PfpI family protein [Desulfobacteraceae bacterium]|nr:DJ-1/PfpI family protein [Desulfobacteraceae bacterium]
MKQVLLLLCKGTEIYEAAAFHDVIGWADDVGDTLIKMVTVSVEPEITCTFGLRVIPDRLLADINVDDFDALAIPGGFHSFGFYDDAYSDMVGEVIRRFDEQEKPIAAICVGALAIGRSGVLTGRNATTYHLMGGGRRNQLAQFGVDVVDAQVVTDGNIITSTSPATAMEVAFTLVEHLTGKPNADKVRTLMGFPTDRT